LIVENIIESSLFPLKSSDSVDFALETMLSLQISALPVVDNEQIIGFIESSSLIGLNPKTKIKGILKNNLGWIINEQHHYSEALKQFSEFKADCLAVVDAENKFKGIVSKSSLINFIAQSYTLSAEGSVICLEMVARNYSLNELNRIIENEDAKILGVNIFNIPDSSRIMINIKLNTVFTDRIILSLQRFGYEITATFYNNHDISDSDNRYKSLLKYLEF